MGNLGGVCGITTSRVSLARLRSTWRWKIGDWPLDIFIAGLPPDVARTRAAFEDLLPVTQDLKGI